MKRLVGKRVAIIGAGSCGEGVGNGKAMAILFAEQGGKILCIDADQTGVRVVSNARPRRRRHY